MVEISIIYLLSSIHYFRFAKDFLITMKIKFTFLLHVKQQQKQQQQQQKHHQQQQQQQQQQQKQKQSLIEMCR